MAIGDAKVKQFAAELVAKMTAYAEVHQQKTVDAKTPEEKLQLSTVARTLRIVALSIKDVAELEG